MSTKVETNSIIAVSGKTVRLEIEYSNRKTLLGDRPEGEPDFPSINYRLFGTSAYLKPTDKDSPDYPYLYVLGQNNTLAVCKEVKKQMGSVIKPKSNILVRIHQTDYDRLKQAEAEHKQPYDEFHARLKAQKEAESSQMPRQLAYIHGYLIGDYSHETHSYVALVRRLTEREKAGRNPEQGDPETAWVVEERLGNVRMSGQTVQSLKDRPDAGRVIPRLDYRIDNGGDDSIAITQAEFGQMLADDAAWQAAADLIEADKKRLAEEKAKQEAAETAEAKRKTEADELFIWDAGTVYASAGNQMLHSLGALFSEKEGKISLYTTGYASDIPGANTTYSIRDELKAAGFAFDSGSKNWVIAYSPENAQTVIGTLKKYDTKRWPHDLGFGRCWECGTYSKRLDSDGYCGC